MAPMRTVEDAFPAVISPAMFNAVLIGMEEPCVVGDGPWRKEKPPDAAALRLTSLDGTDSRRHLRAERSCVVSVHVQRSSER